MKQLMLPGEIVKKSNALARARWSADSVWEPRLVALLASKVRADDQNFQIYKIHISELIGKAEKLGSGRTYLEISAVVDKIMSRVITVKDENGGKGWTKYNVFSRCCYHPEDGILEMRFDPDLKPHYLNLQRNFAQYNLMEYLMLPSIYSQRIFEILNSWASCPEVIIPLSELHDMLSTPDSLRPDFAQFRRRVLEKAYMDIHNKTELSFEWEPMKQGRSVVAIKFIFSDGKKSLAAKGKKEQNDIKASKKANQYFLKAFECLREQIIAGDVKLNQQCTLNKNKKVVCAFCNAQELYKDKATFNSILNGLKQKN